jgi:hypothetical protein
LKRRKKKWMTTWKLEPSNSILKELKKKNNFF